GLHNYTIPLTGGSAAPLLQYTTAWANPFPLFPTTFNGGYLGIAYDPRDRSFWLGSYGRGVIEHWSFEGELLASFSTGLDDLGFLALDPADYTLWTFTQDDPTALYQFTTAGVALGPTYYDAFAAADETPNLLGGEFAPLAAAVPEPGASGLLVTISLALM